ncbi:hypothetical protein NQ317_004526 [Molorchus minor]|uniref:Uncharacterized protein n=1 Tax=Molorchus minor TaxID=1323400 RepID=A0ABQ9JXN4_9CUCU|nr:hypothetical protein NQ317_004526 [Molorchus minor]
MPLVLVEFYILLRSVPISVSFKIHSVALFPIANELLQRDLEKTPIILKPYPDDLKESLGDELVQFAELL